MNILCTGFEPFGEWTVNPTAEAVHFLDSTKINEYEIIGRVLKLRYKEIKSQMLKLVEKYNPEVIILTGQAGGNKIRLETRAKNLVHTRIPYNCGTSVDNLPIEENGPESIEGRLPYSEIYLALKDKGIPVQISEDAGSFGCNQVFYYSLYKFPSIPSGFIHVPLLPSQVKPGEAYMHQKTITNAIQRVVETTVTEIENNSVYQELKG